MSGEQVRELARAVAELAGDVRRLAAEAETGAGVAWSSTSADAFRQRLAGEVAQVRQASMEVDEVAHSLARHADAVDAAVRQLSAWVDRLVPGA